jgi:hypothetical protein
VMICSASSSRPTRVGGIAEGDVLGVVPPGAEAEHDRPSLTVSAVTAILASDAGYAAATAG